MNLRHWQGHGNNLTEEQEFGSVKLLWNKESIQMSKKSKYIDIDKEETLIQETNL